MLLIIIPHQISLKIYFLSCAISIKIAAVVYSFLDEWFRIIEIQIEIQFPMQEKIFCGLMQYYVS